MDEMAGLNKIGNEVAKELGGFVVFFNNEVKDTKLSALAVWYKDRPLYVDDILTKINVLLEIQKRDLESELSIQNITTRFINKIRNLSRDDPLGERKYTITIFGE